MGKCARGRPVRIVCSERRSSRAAASLWPGCWPPVRRTMPPGRQRRLRPRPSRRPAGHRRRSRWRYPRERAKRHSRQSNSPARSREQTWPLVRRRRRLHRCPTPSTAKASEHARNTSSRSMPNARVPHPPARVSMHRGKPSRNGPRHRVPIARLSKLQADERLALSHTTKPSTQPSTSQQPEWTARPSVRNRHSRARRIARLGGAATTREHHDARQHAGAERHRLERPPDAASDHRQP